MAGRSGGAAAAHLEGAHERLVDAHHGARVVELAAVVGRAEDGDQLPLCEELVPILHHLRPRPGGSTPRLPRDPLTLVRRIAPALLQRLARARAQRPLCTGSSRWRGAAQRRMPGSQCATAPRPGKEKIPPRSPYGARRFKTACPARRDACAQQPAPLAARQRPGGSPPLRSHTPAPSTQVQDQGRAVLGRELQHRGQPRPAVGRGGRGCAGTSGARGKLGPNYA
jgi:hypothetical protein